jgi:hypothetical protein
MNPNISKVLDIWSYSCHAGWLLTDHISVCFKIKKKKYYEVKEGLTLSILKTDYAIQDAIPSKDKIGLITKKAILKQNLFSQDPI